MKANMRKRLITLLIIGCISIFSSSIAHTAVLYVPGEYSTIQEAVDAVTAARGGGAGADTIIVASGVYEEEVTLIKNLTVVGLGLPTVGSISASIGSFKAADNCVIDGLKIHSLEISGKSNVVIKNCVLLGEVDELTSATIANAQGIFIENNVFSDKYYGGTAGSRVNISNVTDLTFTNNVVLTKATGTLTTDVITALSLNVVTNASLTNNIIKAVSSGEGKGVGIDLSLMSNAAITNNIICGTTFSLDGNSANTLISYNDLPEGISHVDAGITLGPNNFSVEPVFTDGKGYYLKPTSPLVDAGIKEAGIKSDVGSYRSITFYPDDYAGVPPSLQEVINTAGPNDTIYLSPGTYAAAPYTIKNETGTADVTSYGILVIHKDIHIIGSGKDTEIIGPVQFIFSDGSLENLTVKSPNDSDLLTEVDYDLDGRQDGAFTGSILVANGSPDIENVMLEPDFAALAGHGITGVDTYGTGIAIIENTSGSPTSPIISNVILKKFVDAIKVEGYHNELVLSPVVEHSVFDQNVNGVNCDTSYALLALRNNIFSNMANAIDLAKTPYKKNIIDNIQSNLFYNNTVHCLYDGAEVVPILANKRNNQEGDPKYLLSDQNKYATLFDSPAIDIDAGLEHYSVKRDDGTIEYYESADKEYLLAEVTEPVAGDSTKTIKNYDPSTGAYLGKDVRYFVSGRIELLYYESFNASDVSQGEFYADGTPYQKAPGTGIVTVSLLSAPTGLLKGTIPLMWTTTDADGDPLSIDVKYSINAAPYEDLALGLNDDAAYEWESADYSDSNNYKIKVKAYKTENPARFAEVESGAFGVDNTPPVIAITSPSDNTGLAAASIRVEGTVSDVNLDSGNVEIMVLGLLDWQTATVAAPDFHRDNVDIPTDGTRAIIVAQATDLAGNISTDKVGVIKGYMRYIELPRYYTREENANNLSSIAVAQDLVHLMGSTDYDYIDMPSDTEIYDEGLLNNFTGHQDPGSELDAQGLASALQHYDPYGPDTATGYNYAPAAINDYQTYLKNIVHWLSWAIKLPGVPTPHGIPEDYPEDYCRAPYIPALAPLSAYIEGYSRWVVINGCAASESPVSTTEPWRSSIVNPNITVYGLFMTDPQTRGIGQDMYIAAASLDDYLQPLGPGISDPYTDKYVSVIEPPADPDFDLDVSGPAINKSTLTLLNIAEFVNGETADDFSSHLIDGALVVDLEELGAVKSFSTSANLMALFVPEAMASEDTSSINWKDIIPSVRLLDDDFIAAVDGSEVRDFLKVHRNDTGEDYYIIPFDQYVGGRYLSKAAILMDAATSAIIADTYVTEPTRYVQIAKEKAVEAVIKAHPEAKTKSIDTRLVWEPGQLTLSRFYPYWEVTAGAKKYYVAE